MSYTSGSKLLRSDLFLFILCGQSQERSLKCSIIQLELWKQEKIKQQQLKQEDIMS